MNLRRQGRLLRRGAPRNDEGCHCERSEAISGEDHENRGENGTTDGQGGADHRRGGRAGDGRGGAVRARRGRGGPDRHRCRGGREPGAAARRSGRQGRVSARRTSPTRRPGRRSSRRHWRISASSTSSSTMPARSPARASSTPRSTRGTARIAVNLTGADARHEALRAGDPRQRRRLDHQHLLDRRADRA